MQGPAVSRVIAVLFAGLLGLRVPLSVKLQAMAMGLAVRFGRRPAGLTLAEYFRRCGQGADDERSCGHVSL